MRLVASDEDLRNKLQVSVSKLDIGDNDENLGELCELVYLPRCSNKKSLKTHISEQHLNGQEMRNILNP